MCYPMPLQPTYEGPGLDDTLKDKDTNLDRAMFDTAVEATGLGDAVRDASGGHSISSFSVQALSGGQQQRLSFARAIYSRAEMVSGRELAAEAAF